MTVAYWCVLVAALMPIVWAGAAKSGIKGFDNARPRELLGSLSGWPARANFAQQNSYEAFPPFAAGVIIAHLCDTPQATIDALALTFTIARVAYGLFYIADRSTLRSLVWLLAFGSTVALFVTSAG
ncbi:MAG: MAPEG family protein [Gammaproteobacteria bacterium]|nr:MAPEG family protein [Gammaproteobacteria bacterium]